MTNETTPGASVSPSPTQTINIQPPIAPPTNGLAVASLVLGIIALVTFWIPFLGWVPVVVGLVLGLVALQNPYGRGMAIGGIACSGVALAIKVWFWVALIGVIGAASAAHHT